MTIWRRSLSSWGCCISSKRGPALAGLLLLGLALSTPAPSSAQIPRGRAMVRASLVARSLAREIKKVQKRFEKNSDALEDIEGPGGAPAYERSEVSELLDLTEEGLLQAIDKVGKRMKDSVLISMEEWVREEFRILREELDSATGPVLVDMGRQPRVVAVLASLGPVPVTDEAGTQAKQGCGPDGSLLARIAWHIYRLFFLSKEEMLRMYIEAHSLPPHFKASLFLYKDSELDCLDEKCQDLSRSMVLDDQKIPLDRGIYFYELKPKDELSVCSSQELINRPQWCRLDFYCNDGPIFCRVRRGEERSCREGNK